MTNNDNNKDKTELFETSHFSFKMRVAGVRELGSYEWFRFGSLALKISDTAGCRILLGGKKDYVKIDYINSYEIPKYVKKYTERYMFKYYNKVVLSTSKEFLNIVLVPKINVEYSEPKFEY